MTFVDIPRWLMFLAKIKTTYITPLTIIYSFTSDRKLEAWVSCSFN